MNKIGIISDIHANHKALEKALGILKEEHVNKTFVCGDVVGYGKHPNECCEKIRALNCQVVAGNHDWAVAGLTRYEDSHSASAVKGIEYTKAVITPPNLAWLKGLPLYHKEGETEFVHASLLEPERWHYLTLGSAFVGSAYKDVRDTFQAMKGQLCFVGHSHIPTIFLEKKPNKIKVIEPNKPFYELGKKRAVIDVGSIGKPRTSSKKATVVIYETKTQKLTFKRFPIR